MRTQLLRCELERVQPKASRLHDNSHARPVLHDMDFPFGQTPGWFRQGRHHHGTLYRSKRDWRKKAGLLVVPMALLGYPSSRSSTVVTPNISSWVVIVQLVAEGPFARL